MATQFDPIAKDESLNTTEVTPRNVADVLAQGLAAIEQAIASTSKYETISGTTDQYGVLVTNFTTSNFIIISAVSAGNVVTPFTNASYAWRLRVTDFNGNPKLNTAVTIYAYYIDP